MELASSPLPAPSPSVGKPPAAPEAKPAAPALAGWLKQRGFGDWFYALALVAGACVAYFRYGAAMDGYDTAILVLHVPLLAALGWAWRPFRLFLATVAALALAGIWLYQGDLARAEQVFFLKYLLSSQTAIAWMSACFFIATGAYCLGLAARAGFAERTGSALTWAAAIMGAVGLSVRWYESYLLGPDIGHIPISNLYEVFVLFSLVTALLYLFYEGRYGTRRLGAFVLLAISVAVAFLLWYAFTRGAYQIQPLVPALQSYWMKIHVPANFVGYGGFALAAMAGLAWLLSARGTLAERLPAPEVLEDVMYKAIAIGFAFFTIATILGALWAAEAWGSYWSWDPKETWALIVWLNYAAWLHIRLANGAGGRLKNCQRRIAALESQFAPSPREEHSNDDERTAEIRTRLAELTAQESVLKRRGHKEKAMLAWWALAGLLVTTFAFLGVNLFLSGLHSYGSL
ncbi:MAG: c-type cytochrome biogenesis protein CcsB [Azoarcus sp.]|jgi:cytochrome c-type biogenesis protein CcsB|nr:c-type cytochrome biogenesis protein CcsB [Azoarcus sp.]